MYFNQLPLISVGVVRLELTTSSPPDQHANQLRHTPIIKLQISKSKFQKKIKFQILKKLQNPNFKKNQIPDSEKITKFKFQNSKRTTRTHDLQSPRLARQTTEPVLSEAEGQNLKFLLGCKDNSFSAKCSFYA